MTSERNPEAGFMKSKEKNGKSVPIESECSIIENAGSSSIKQWKEGTTLIVGDSMLAGMEEKRTSGNRSVKVCIFLGAAIQDMYGYLKPLLKRNLDNITLHVRTNNSVDETSTDILNEILSLKNFIEKLCPTCRVIVSNLIYRSDNGKVSLTVKNVNDHRDTLNLDVVNNRNVGGNCLNNSGLHLNSTGYGKLAINFIKKMKNLSKN